MKIVTDSKLIALANDFADIRETMKAMERRQKDLRASLVAALGDDNSAMIGEWLLVLSERVRTDLDKDALAEALGERFKEFQRASSYEVLDIKKA